MSVDTRPNILLLCLDQVAWRAVGAYGNASARTPNIDGLAGRGVRFDTCYTPCPLCRPARASFWTGRYPHETGVMSNGWLDPAPQVPPAMPTLGTLVSAAGYEVVHFGKEHDAGSLRGFQRMEAGELPVDADPRWPVSSDTRRDRFTTEQAVEFLAARKQSSPLLMAVDLNNPHDICSWIGANQGARPCDSTGRPLPDLPDNFDDADFVDRPLSVQYICCSHNRLAQAAEWSDAQYRHYLEAYYHYLERADAEVGRILAALEASPIADNTLVILFADHGEGMASHRMVTKQVSFYEETTRVPLIVSGRGVRDGGRIVGNALVSLLDLLPTICDYAQAAIPSDLSGISLRPWIEDAAHDAAAHEYLASEWYTEWGFTYEPGRMIRSPRYKYMAYRESDGEAFYDLKNDPGETRTLIKDPAFSDALAAHRRMLADHLSATSDPFLTMRCQVERRWRQHAPGYRHHRGPAAPTVMAAETAAVPSS